MSTRQEVGVFNVKYHCHKATRTLNVTQTLAWLTQLPYPVDSKLYSDFSIVRDCFMILMLTSFQYNALSRGNQRPNLPYKKACRGIFGGFSLHQLLPETMRLCYWNRHFSNNILYITNIYSAQLQTSHLQPINQEHIYTSSRVAGDMKFNSQVFQRTQRLPSRSTFYVPNLPSPWDTTVHFVCSRLPTVYVT